MMLSALKKLSYDEQQASIDQVFNVTRSQKYKKTFFLMWVDSTCLVDVTIKLFFFVCLIAVII